MKKHMLNFWIITIILFGAFFWFMSYALDNDPTRDICSPDKFYEAKQGYAICIGDEGALKTVNIDNWGLISATPLAVLLFALLMVINSILFIGCEGRWK